MLHSMCDSYCMWFDAMRRMLIFNVMSVKYTLTDKLWAQWEHWYEKAAAAAYRTAFITITMAITVLFTYNSLDNTFYRKHICVLVLINAHNSRIDARCTLFSPRTTKLCKLWMHLCVRCVCVSDQHRKKRIFKNTQRLNQWMTLCQCVYWLISAYSAITVDD